MVFRSQDSGQNAVITAYKLKHCR